MHLSYYCMKEMEVISKFQDEWFKKNKEEPDKYPLNMTQEEWHDHFIHWEEAQP